MVVKATSRVNIQYLDIAYLGLFLGLRVNELVRQRMERAGFAGVRDSHGYLIQHLIESDRSITELARRMNITQQAVSKTVRELTRLGLLESSPAKDRRSKRVRLSRDGWECVRFGRRVRKQLEKRLTAAADRRKYGQAKATIIQCLHILGGLGAIKSRLIRQPDQSRVV